ncbi:MAG: hypothetical protein A3I68_04580 [Candidatus Melainabacteria bacterium RIFCSPLOWO2_02_FULL_35_15]|nr:MAG: hypothetical protein A3F80_06650 [Candidatus Melainabacteria bacterium RIFCSPLOWO2_12_FULL_35_11]OGI13649.1 MAG: hypothetical protein A3I68_04580 [Candidatus Melainabacteria bacterium RIFCSPLOWO2_02_FULL_35_15]
MQNQKIKIVLDDEKIKKVLKIKDVINIVEEGFRKKGLGLVSLPPKIGPKLPAPGAFADSMSVSVSNEKGCLETFGIKWIGAFAKNLKIGLPYLNSIIILNEPKHGIPVAILKGNWITAIRTAAVSAVCAKYLAPKKNKITVGIFGLGVQAYVHVLAFKAIFKDVNFILYNHGDNFLSDFLERWPKEKFNSSKDFHEVVKNSDIILSATTFPAGITPYIFHKDLKGDVLILPVDYGTRIDPRLYKCLDEVYTDDIPQYELKNKLRHYFPLNAPKIKKEIGEIIAEKYKRKNTPKRILVFNLGIALFDILVAKLFLEKLRRI